MTNSKKAKILIIEDDEATRRMLRVCLITHGYQLTEAASGQDGLKQVAHDSPDLVLLDLGLPDIDGLTIIGKLRGWSPVPIIVLSGRGCAADKVKALDSGADDYVTKPFNARELMARIRVAFRHAANDRQGPVEPVFTSGKLKVDLEQRQVFVGEKEVHLTPIEYRILTTLVKHSGRVVTHQQILSQACGPDHEQQTPYLRVYMTNLRRKIEPDPARPRYLLTDSGIGYRLASQI